MRDMLIVLLMMVGGVVGNSVGLLVGIGAIAFPGAHIVLALLSDWFGVSAAIGSSASATWGAVIGLILGVTLCALLGLPFLRTRKAARRTR